MEFVIGRTAAEDDEHTEVSILIQIHKETATDSTSRLMVPILMPTSQSSCIALARPGLDRWCVGSWRIPLENRREQPRLNEDATCGRISLRKSAWEKT